MKIVIEMEIADEYADPDYDLGVTQEGYNRLMDALTGLGYDIDIHRAS